MSDDEKRTRKSIARALQHRARLVEAAMRDGRVPPSERMAGIYRDVAAWILDGWPVPRGRKKAVTTQREPST
jgi:hypothetical protein